MAITQNLKKGGLLLMTCDELKKSLIFMFEMYGKVDKQGNVKNGERENSEAVSDGAEAASSSISPLSGS